MNGDTQTEVISGFRRAGEAQAYARGYNAEGARLDSCSDCDLGTPNQERFCAHHDIAHASIHPKVIDGVAKDTHVVVLKRG